ncbi:MAG TPA: FGGY-family carbohydrate kinase [Acidimicrobiales bacterium]|nr:FGGY-family carbohydrate kinase [Acidimicrobiales bacterium]
MPERALALDLGSSSVRGMVFEWDGAGRVEPVAGAFARRLRRLDTAEPGQATFDGAGYIADLEACLDDLQAAGHLDGVTKVGMDSQWHSIVVVDASGAPRSPVLSWADTRARPAGQSGPAFAAGPAVDAGTALDAEDVQRAEALRQRTGCAMSPMYWTFKCPWLAEQVGGDALGRGGRFLGLAELVGLALLGDPSMSVGMASGTGLLANASGQWDTEALELAGVGLADLAPLAPHGWRGTLTADNSRRWPALARAEWAPAIGDGAAANLGVGCDRPGRAALTVGTSAAVRAVRPASQAGHLPANLWRYLVDSERVVEGAAYSSGGQLYSWALSLWEGTAPGPTGATGGAAAAAGSVSHEVDFGLDIGVGAGSDGVLVMPWHAGTRPPSGYVRSGSGSVVGLGLGHHGEHIVSAAVEAVCFQLAGGLEALERATGAQFEVVANGGAIEKGALWRQRLSAALGRPLVCPSIAETTARGAAIFAFGAGEAGGTLGSTEATVVVPDPADVRAMAAARRRWERWYGDMASLFASDEPGSQSG